MVTLKLKMFYISFFPISVYLFTTCCPNVCFMLKNPVFSLKRETGTYTLVDLKNIIVKCVYKLTITSLVCLCSIALKASHRHELV